MNTYMKTPRTTSVLKQIRVTPDLWMKQTSKIVSVIFGVTCLLGVSMGETMIPGKVVGSPHLDSIITVPTHPINEYNLGLFTVVLDQYVKTGRYEEDLAKVDTQAQAYLAERVAENARAKDPKKLALVLDIDETSLSNMAIMQKLGWGFNAKLFDEAQNAARDPAIKPTLALYRFAISHGVSVFFVTGRPEKMLKATETNLKREGYATWSQLDLAPNDYHLHSVIPFKSQTRAKIESEGYDIALNVGDQYSDLEGGHADRGYKLPDPFYYIP